MPLLASVTTEKQAGSPLQATCTESSALWQEETTLPTSPYHTVRDAPNAVSAA